jgi:hypothetical protein
LTPLSPLNNNRNNKKDLLQINQKTMKNFTRTSKNRFNRKFYNLLILLFISLSGFSQNVAINTTGTAPNSSAGLDVDFPNKGILIPRVALVSTSSFAPLSAHVAGMIVYNTATAGNVVPGFYYDDGTKWTQGFIKGNALGDMLYWDGTQWQMIPIGIAGQFLQISGSNIPAWGGGAFAAITTTAASAITGITATSGGNITSDGGSAVLSRGVCWNTVTGPTIANNKTTDGTGTGIFVSSLTGLTPVTTYYVRAYSMNSSVISYGNEITFTTLPVLPTLAATTAATSITGTTATSGGNVTSTGGAAITERGICYGIAANPTTANTKVIDPSPGLGVFASNLTGLTGYTTYYVRAYATNSVGTAYGTQISFTTSRIPPTLITVAASSIAGTTATSGGSMTWNGGGYSNYQAYGVAYATTPNAASPTKVATNSSNFPYTTPIAPWITNLTGLALNTTYYIRAYLDVYPTGTGPWTTIYGNELSFTTPLLQTTPTTTITTTTAVSGGTIGTGVTINARGVCWKTSSGATITDSHTSDGTGTGAFVSNISGLTNLTTYYVRSYCTDNLGTTTYGNEYSFTTGAPKAIGDALAGGKVVYVDATGQHGLIGALVDQSTGAQWGCYGTVTTATGTAIYTGLANTNAIIAACGAGTAAQLAAAYTAGGTGLAGITDWYLPSLDELQAMINQKAVIGMSTACNANGCLYWTSSQYGASSTIAYNLFTIFVSPAYNSYKNTSQYVRAVRAF